MHYLASIMRINALSGQYHEALSIDASPMQYTEAEQTLPAGSSETPRRLSPHIGKSCLCLNCAQTSQDMTPEVLKGLQTT